jgi:hypothetical protein
MAYVATRRQPVPMPAPHPAATTPVPPPVPKEKPDPTEATDLERLQEALAAGSLKRAVELCTEFLDKHPSPCTASRC